MATFPTVRNKEEQEGKVICCHICNAAAHSKEEAAASQFVNVKLYNARDKGQGTALEKSYSLCSDCHLIMKQRLIEGCDISSFFSQSPAKMKEKPEEEFGTD